MPLVMIDVSKTVGSARVRIIGDAVYDAMTTLAGVAVHVLSSSVEYSADIVSYR